MTYRQNKIETQVVVIGSGPSGYSAAFRCSDLGFNTVLVERYSELGGVCLNVGCIPSKALLHLSKIVKEVEKMKEKNVISNKLDIDIDGLRKWKKDIVSKITNNLKQLSKGKNIKLIQGNGRFYDDKTILVETKKEIIYIQFEYAIIASGSRPSTLPQIFHKDSRIWNSTDALELRFIPDQLLIVGCGIIGLEMATIYQSLGSNVDIVETSDQILPMVDIDMIKIFTNSIRSSFNLILKTKIDQVRLKEDGIEVCMIEKDRLKETVKKYDAVLVSVGRLANSDLLDLSKVGVQIDKRGFIIVNDRMQTNRSNIYAIGDVVGQPMLAHKGIYEGYLVAEILSGARYYFDAKIIPSIVFSDPEIAWVGMTEQDLRREKIDYSISVFPWYASGRAIASGCEMGVTKLIFEKESQRILGGTVIGSNGGEIMGEIGLAIETGCDIQDISLTIHAHPTLYESINSAAKMAEGSFVDMLSR